MAKYEYKFVSAGLNLFTSFPYEKIIRDHAEEGWRLVQIFNQHNGSTHIIEMHIIFEREI